MGISLVPQKYGKICVKSLQWKYHGNKDVSYVPEKQAKKLSSLYRLKTLASRKNRDAVRFSKERHRLIRRGRFLHI